MKFGLKHIQRMLSRKFLATVIAAAAALPAFAISHNRILLDADWRFSNSADSTFHSPGYDDSRWQKVSLPHDWSVLHDFNSEEPSGNDGGYLPTGKGWYRKTFEVPESMAGKPCELYFEGAYMDSEVFINGHKAGGHPYGYTSFRCNIGPWLKAGTNTLAVKVDNSRQKNSRWYTGSGIYRHVWLEPHAEVYIKPWSLHVTTPVVERKRALARISFAIADSAAKTLKEPLPVPVRITLSTQGATAATISDTVRINPGETVKYCSYEAAVDNPRLWDGLNAPALYTATVVLTLPDGEEAESEKFGFRTIEYSAADGFRLNGKPMLISGACIHHDNGILGAASYDDAEIRKAVLLKEAGFNAVRTSHNPPAPAFLDACDSLGLLVIDEAFDGWRAEKNVHDYHELFDKWNDADISAMVLRDRNHPSIMAWSIGNEIIERKTPEAVATAKMLADRCRALDGYRRPVTQALAAWDPDWEIYDPLAAEHDIVGYNYMIHKAEGDHQRVPSRVMWQTESYPRDAFANWEKTHDLPYVIGDFVWTGIDYIGESGIGRYWYEGDPEGEHFHRPLWPWHNSYCGDIDIIGGRKPISHYRELLYSDTPKMHLAVREPQGYFGKIKEGMWATYPTKDSWNWHGHEGKSIEVEVVSSYTQAELYLNGELIGRQPTDREHQFKAVFTIDYKPGELKAVALDSDGNIAAEEVLATSGKPHAVRLKADREYLPASSQALAYITAEIVDKNGNPVTDAALPVTFTIDGEADIIATGSANPKDPAGYFHNKRLTWEGRALAVAKANGKKGKDVRIKATVPGLKAATITLPTR